MHDGGSGAPHEDPLVVRDQKGRPLRFSTGNTWTPLVDNEVAFQVLLDAVARAERRVLITQLMFEPQLQTVFPTAGAAPDRPLEEAGRSGSGRLAEELRSAARRGVHIRIVLNENTLVPDHVDEMRRYLDDERHVAVRAARRNPGVMHAKLMVVDDEAYLVGSPLQQMYWDTRLHCAQELRRGDKRPIHDVSVRLHGPVVRDLVEQFARLWQTSTGDAGDAEGESEALAPPRTDRERPPQDKIHHHEEDDHREERGRSRRIAGATGLRPRAGLALQVVLTAPHLGEEVLPLSRPNETGDEPEDDARPLRGTANTATPDLVPEALAYRQQREEPNLVTLGARLIDRLAQKAGGSRAAGGGVTPPQPGELTLLDAYARVYDHAERFVYAENQYFTSSVMADLIDRALARNPQLEVILVLNEHMDIPSYDGAQLRLLQRLLRAHPERLGLFSLWTTRSARGSDGIRGLRHVYVHSKATVVDDRWATVGSANWDGASLEGAQELGLPGVRNEELNVVVHDAHSEHREAGLSAAAELRIDLWSEHLGLPAARLQALSSKPDPAGSWLALWRKVAEANLKGLHEGREDLQGFVLPYAPDLPLDNLRVWK